MARLNPQAQRSRRRPFSLFIYYNLNKRSVTCNIKSDGGKALLRQLIAKADVLIENMAPGTFARLGFDYPSGFPHTLVTGRLRGLEQLTVEGGKALTMG
jgi:crotonobetainyl-CoA:carnitine CoA-transferase CaiB-like acyl-CoA transferase